MRDHKVQLSVFMKIWMCLIEGKILKNRHSFIFEIWACHTDILSLDETVIFILSNNRKKPCIKKPHKFKKG